MHCSVSLFSQSNVCILCSSHMTCTTTWEDPRKTRQAELLAAQTTPAPPAQSNTTGKPTNNHLHDIQTTRFDEHSGKKFLQRTVYS